MTKCFDYDNCIPRWDWLPPNHNIMWQCKDENNGPQSVSKEQKKHRERSTLLAVSLILGEWCFVSLQTCITLWNSMIFLYCSVSGIFPSILFCGTVNCWWPPPLLASASAASDDVQWRSGNRTILLCPLPLVFKVKPTKKFRTIKVRYLETKLVF